MPRLANKVAVVTGGGNGIGRACCLRLAAEGAKIVVADQDQTGTERVAAEIVAEGGAARAFALDVRSSAAVNSLVDGAVAGFGQLDIMVTCAGIYPEHRFWEIPEEAWDAVLGVNLKGTFLCCQAAARHMMQRKSGKIITIASNSIMSIPIFAHYISSKGGVIGLTRAMSRELGPYGINVNAVAPGPIWTEAALRVKDQIEPFFAETRARRSIQREGYPPDVAAVVAFFASADSDFITGQTLLVDGGEFFL